MLRTIARIGAVQLAWLACAYGAAAAMPLAAVAACLAALGINCLLSDHPRALLKLALVLGIYGFAAESALTANGAISYSAGGPTPFLAPLWIVTLWMAFAGMIRPAFGWLLHRPLTAALIGGGLAPFSYAAAAKLGALQFSDPFYIGWLGLSLIWTIALPGAIIIQHRLTTSSGP